MNQEAYNFPPGAYGPVAIERAWSFIRRSLGLETGGLERVLDIGCHHGTYSRKLSAHCAHTIGLDISKEHLLVAKGTVSSRVELVQASAESLPFKDSAFDAVICIETLEHISEHQRAVEEISRVLRPGGRVVVTMPNKLCPFQYHLTSEKGERLGLSPLRRLRFLSERKRGVIQTAHEFTLGEARELLARNGLRVERVHFLMPLFESMMQDYPPKYWLVYYLLHRISRAAEWLRLSRPFGLTMIMCAIKRDS